MKLVHPPVFTSILFLAGVFCLLFATTPNVRASAEDQIDQALVASKAWIHQIDAGQYDESYAFGCGAMHDKVPQERWPLALKTFASLYGPVVSRKQVSHVYKPNGYEGAEGEFMVVTYDTSFKRLPSGIEVVVLKWEGGKWRGAGYSAGPKKSSDDDSTPPPTTSTTETHTEKHVKPLPQ